MKMVITLPRSIEGSTFWNLEHPKLFDVAKDLQVVISNVFIYPRFVKTGLFTLRFDEIGRGKGDIRYLWPIFYFVMNGNNLFGSRSEGIHDPTHCEIRSQTVRCANATSDHYCASGNNFSKPGHLGSLQKPSAARRKGPGRGYFLSM